MELGITLWTILPVVEPLKAMISADMELRTDLKVESMLWERDKRTTLSYSIMREEHSGPFIHLIQPQTHANLECHFVKDLFTHNYLKLPNGLVLWTRACGTLSNILNESKIPTCVA